MTHDELLLNINRAIDYTSLQDGNVNMATEIKALRAVVELHKPLWIDSDVPSWCAESCGSYPCNTIQSIEKELE